MTGERVEKLLKQVNLRNEYRVYEANGAYLVKSENQRGQRYECKVPSAAISYLCEKMRGQRVTAEQAGAALRPVAERFKLPYTYGDKLRYSGQYVLIATVAAGMATVTKEGRSYMYKISG